MEKAGLQRAGEHASFPSSSKIDRLTTLGKLGKGLTLCASTCCSLLRQILICMVKTRSTLSVTDVQINLATTDCKLGMNLSLRVCCHAPDSCMDTAGAPLLAHAKYAPTELKQLSYYSSSVCCWPQSFELAQALLLPLSGSCPASNSISLSIPLPLAVQP